MPVLGGVKASAYREAGFTLKGGRLYQEGRRISFVTARDTVAKKAGYANYSSYLKTLDKFNKEATGKGSRIPSAAKPSDFKLGGKHQEQMKKVVRSKFDKGGQRAYAQLLRDLGLKGEEDYSRVGDSPERRGGR